jgi:Tol biopolymer transport system component
MEPFTVDPLMQASFTELETSAILSPSSLLEDSLNLFQEALAAIAVTPHSWTERVSLNSNSNPGNGHSTHPSLSADGRYVVFESLANNLVPGDINGDRDVFVYDRQTNTTRAVSVDIIGNHRRGTSSHPSISADGRYVVFQSTASFSGIDAREMDTDGQSDIYIKDLKTSEIYLLSTFQLGYSKEAFFNPTISADGRHVAFEWIVPNQTLDSRHELEKILFVYDRLNRSIIKVASEPGWLEDNYLVNPYQPSLSADGRYVTFHSYAIDLVDNNNNEVVDNEARDIFVYDQQTKLFRRVSIGINNSETNHHSTNPSISGNGRYIAFESYASNLVDNDTNWAQDVFVYDLHTNITRRISLDSNGKEGNSHSYQPSISADGQWVTFLSDATNLVSSDSNSSTDVFLHNLQTGVTRLLSVDASGNQKSGNFFAPSISGDGRAVAFHSDATDLVTSDTQGQMDVFVRDIPPTFRMNPVTVMEGNEGSTNVTFTASLSGARDYPVSVSYIVVDDTAKFSSDYGLVLDNSIWGNQGRLVFLPGQTTASFSIPIFGDRQVEMDETFLVKFFDPINAELEANQVVGKILNDDVPNLSINNVTQLEGTSTSISTTFEFTVSLDAPSPNPVAITYYTSSGTAIAGSDYAATNGNLFFNPGETSQTIRVTAVTDASIEADETFFVNLVSPTHAAIAVSRGTGTILNDDVPIVLLEGTNGNDTLTGDNFANTINGKAGEDILYGNDGNDTISGGAGNDIAYGGNGNDVINGNSENDTLYGGNGNDQINGGSQDDLLVGGVGADTLLGGTGSDRYLYSALNEAGDTIQDFMNGNDVLDLRDLFRNLNYQGNDPIANHYLKFAFNAGKTDVQINPDGMSASNFTTLVTLNGITPAQLVLGQTLLV